MKLTNEQTDTIQAMISTISDNKIVAVNSVAGSGKEQPLYSKVLTPSGWTTMGKLNIGDKVCSPYGTTNTVVNIYPQGTKDVYEVYFTDGTVAECGLEHLWYVKSKTRRKGQYITVPLKDLIGKPLRSKSTYYYEVPLTTVTFKEQQLPIHPYLLGCLIGDGSICQSSIMLSSHLKDKEILDKCIELLPEGMIAGSIRNTSENGLQQIFKSETKTSNSLKNTLKNLNLLGLKSHEKFIPEVYLFSSTEQRIELLKGLMDTDGYVGNANRISISTTSSRLVTDITSLVQSLGGTTNTFKDERDGKRTGYQIIVKFNNLNPFWLKRKADKVTPRLQNKVRKCIKSIVKTGRKTLQQCIELDGDNLYITDGFITTHNTTTALAVVNALKPTTAFYTAFNKAIIEDARCKFPANVECKTLHALAYKYVKLPNQLKELTYTCIKEPIQYQEKSLVIKTIGKYFRSKYVDLYEFLDNELIHNTIKELVVKYIDLMQQGKINVTFDYMVKILHIMLVNDEIDLQFDLFILDEAQDLVEVTLEIFKLVKAKKKLMLGDTNQNIYSFMDTVNGFNLLDKNTLNFRLTRSFRCNEEVAETVERFGKRFLSSDFVYKGNPDMGKSVDGSVSYQSRTNATILERVHTLQMRNSGYTLSRSISEIAALPLAIVNASNNKPIYSNQYKFLTNQYKEYLKQAAIEAVKGNRLTFYGYLLDVFWFDPAIEGAVNTLRNFSKKNINIFGILNKAKTDKKDPLTTLTTTHAFKGLETDTVYIESNLNSMIETVLKKEELDESDTECFNLYYVALSRARCSIINNVY